MIKYECRKIISVKIIFCLLVIDILFCFCFWLQNRGVEKAANTPVLQSVYSEVGGEITDARAEKIESLIKKRDDILGSESEMEQKYRKGEIDVDDYMKYRDDFHLMDSRKDAIDLVYERYRSNRKNGFWLIFDGYYNQLFDSGRNQWGLILSVFLLAVLLVCCESRELAPVIGITRIGKRGIWLEKVAAIVVISIICAVIYGLEEYGITGCFFPDNNLSAPVQSISCLSDVKISANIGQWLIIILVLRIFNVAVMSAVFCTVLCFVKSKKAGILILTAAIFVPMILSEVLQLDGGSIISKWIAVYPLFS